MDRPGGGDQGDGDVDAALPGHAAQHAHACAVGQCDASDAGRQDLRYAGAGADAETDTGSVGRPSRGVRRHRSSFPVSGMVTDGPSCGNRRSIWSTVMCAVHALIDLVRVCCTEVSSS